MVKIHKLLQGGSYPNCSTIAKELEVSVKTAQRDIECMRDQMGHPIGYDESRHGYFLTQPSAPFPEVMVSEGEVIALLVAQKALEQYRGTPFEHILENAFSKIGSGLKDQISFNPSALLAGISFKSVGTSQADLETFEGLSTAIRTETEVTIEYLKPGSTKTETRRIRPYHLACIQNLWYAISFDPSRNDIRKFALPRIQSWRLEKAKFVRPADFSAEKYFGKSFGVFTGTEDIEVKIHFDAFAASFIREKTWHHTQVIEERRKRCLVLKMHVPRLEEVQTWVLGWGEHAKVLAPRALAADVKKAAAGILAQYAEARR